MATGAKCRNKKVFLHTNDVQPEANGDRWHIEIWIRQCDSC